MHILDTLPVIASHCVNGGPWKVEPFQLIPRCSNQTVVTSRALPVIQLGLRFCFGSTPTPPFYPYTRRLCCFSSISTTSTSSLEHWHLIYFIPRTALTCESPVHIIHLTFYANILKPLYCTFCLKLTVLFVNYTSIHKPTHCISWFPINSQYIAYLLRIFPAVLKQF